MYESFTNAVAVMLALWQSGFYQLVHAKSIQTYQEAWYVIEENKRKK